MQFMLSSLDSLAKGLEKEQFTQVRRFLENKYKNEDAAEEEKLLDQSLNFEDDNNVECNDEEEEEDEDGSYVNIGYNCYRDPVLKKDEMRDVDEKFQLLTKKGVYPYEYLDSMEKFSEKTLPSKEKFYSQLSDSHISGEEYLHAEKVWNTFSVSMITNRQFISSSF